MICIQNYSDRNNFGLMNKKLLLFAWLLISGCLWAEEERPWSCQPKGEMQVVARFQILFGVETAG